MSSSGRGLGFSGGGGGEGVVHGKRWLHGVFGASAEAGSGTVAGTVYLIPMEVDFPLTIDALLFVKANVGANFYHGLYAEGGADIPDGGALVATSALTAMAGPVSESQTTLMTAAYAVVDPDTYWIALELDDGVAQRFFRTFNELCMGDPPTARKYVRDGGFGALTDPCPATIVSNQPVVMMARVSSVP